ncbi:hypothetical protein GQ55_8G239400 [Panicum hallii var. hallii]|uniref:Uncharacterized protein n=1 Tax=Panicum hallii var. hallii TaxID=1504633 RepID=A0A2T7CQJ5_9POAL|nr:hypothetical protein GQ55_8G239400 [Panicum hallii var. hallii]
MGGFSDPLLVPNIRFANGVLGGISKLKRHVSHTFRLCFTLPARVVLYAATQRRHSRAKKTDRSIKLQTIKTRSLSLAVAATAVAAAVIFALSATVLLGAAAAVVEHTFVVSMI